MMTEVVNWPLWQCCRCQVSHQVDCTRSRNVWHIHN